MKNVKLLFILLIMFISCSSVSAKVVTLDDMVNVINKGVITEEFIDLKENEKDDKTGKIKWRDAQIKAYIENEALIVEYTYTNKDLISKTFGIASDGLMFYLIFKAYKR